MANPWDPERVVDAGLAASLIDEQFPSLSPARVEPLGAGFDNTAYVVHREYVFRFPRRQIAVPWLETEMRVLPRIAPHLPLAIPVPVFPGRPTGRFPWPFAGYRMLAGGTACVANLDEAERGRAAEPLARFLRALHSLPPDGCAGDTIGRLNLAKRIPKTHELLDRIAPLGLVSRLQSLHDLVDAATACRVPRADVLVHGDLYARHLLVDDGRRLSGVIDWGDMHAGDPAIDVSVAWIFLPATAHETFRRAYGGVDDATWSLARFRALHHELNVLLYARDIGDADLVREAVAALQTIAV